MLRRYLIAISTFLAVTGVHAEETSVVAVPTESAQVLPAMDGALVALTTEPLPAIAAKPIRHLASSQGLAQSKTIKAKKHAAARSMLSRAAREQIALYKSAGRVDDPTRQIASDDDEDDPGLDDLDLHRSFSRPRLTGETFDGNDDKLALPAHIQLRLLMARAKAVDAHVLNQAAAGVSDEVLPDKVKLRLFVARSRAIEAYHKKFGDA